MTEIAQVEFMRELKLYLLKYLTSNTFYLENWIELFQGSVEVYNQLINTDSIMGKCKSSINGKKDKNKKDKNKKKKKLESNLINGKSPGPGTTAEHRSGSSKALEHRSGPRELKSLSGPINNKSTSSMNNKIH